MLVLASASPRRLELLTQAGYRPLVVPAHVDETPDPARSPTDNAAHFAREKALATQARHHGDVVLGADTIVTIGRELMGKPRDRADAERMLRRLSGRMHQVVTCVYIPRVLTFPPVALSVSTSVIFRDIEDAELSDYLDGDEWQDKAGAYAIQGRAAVFAQAVVGSYSNVVGLPLCEVVEELKVRGLAPRLGGQP